MSTTPNDILQANLWAFFKLNGKQYQIMAIYGQCFQCYEYSRCAKGLVGSECLISARMILGTTELTPDLD